MTCGGGGGGNTKPNNAPDAIPTLVAATFVGAAATPAAGELFLSESEDVTLVPGKQLTDLDVTLSTGSLFPGVSESIMSPAFDFDSALAPETQFNSLNRAYLRERVLVNGN